MRKILTLPIKTALSGTIAQYAKSLPKPHPRLIQEAKIETRSRLFEPEFVPVPKRQKPGPVRIVERGTLGIAMPPPARGTMNRPDKSEQRTNLTFNWSPV